MRRLFILLIVAMGFSSCRHPGGRAVENFSVRVAPFDTGLMVLTVYKDAQGKAVAICVARDNLPTLSPTVNKRGVLEIPGSGKVLTLGPNETLFVDGMDQFRLSGTVHANAAMDLIAQLKDKSTARILQSLSEDLNLRPQ